MLKLIKQAAELAMPRSRVHDHRAFCMAAIGIRGDGTLVSARNGSVQVSETIGNGWSFPACHAEARVCRKMDHGGTIYVVRVSRSGGHLQLARPCYDCMMAMRARKVKKVYYSISDTEYGVIDLCVNQRRKK